MAISKITLNGVTQMDVTQKTVTSNTMLNGVTALKNDGTDITGNIASKTSSDLTVSGATVTAPAGHYQNAASKTIPNADATGVLDSDSFYTDSGNRRWRIYVQGYAESGGYVDEGAFGSPNGYNYPAVAANTSITPTESSQTVGGSKYMMEGAVTVNAIPSNYVGSGITQRSSSDLTASGDTVTAPAGYYGSAATKSVASGTAGTPTATKGTVSNHAVSITPSVTNSTGYITGGTKTGTAVSVSASELVSGTLSITSSGTKDVTNYASASVASGSATTPATTVTANPSISVSSGGLITATASATKSVTPTVSAGFVSSGTAGTITVSGSNTSQLSAQAAQTIHPSTADQTIASGKYITGAQTISGVLLTNLLAENIKKGVIVKVGDASDDDCVASVTGTYQGGTGVEFTYGSWKVASNLWVAASKDTELEDGKEIIIYMPYGGAANQQFGLITHPGYIDVHGYINGSSWSIGTTISAALIPVSPGDSLSITATDYGTSNSPVAIIKNVSFPITNGATVTFSSDSNWNSTKNIANQATLTGTVPSDGQYLYMYYGYDNQYFRRMPRKIIINGTTVFDGFKNVYYTGTTQLSTQFTAHDHIMLIYHKALDIDGTEYEGWWCVPSKESSGT